MIRSLLYVIIAIVSVQLGASYAKGLFPTLGPEVVSFLRISIAALIVGLIFRPRDWSLYWRERKWLIPYGMSLGFMNLTFYHSLAKIPLGVAVAIEFTGPLLISFFFSRRLFDFVWILMAAVGLYFLSPFYQSTESISLDPWGVTWALVAGLFWALYIYFGGKVSQVIEAQVASPLGMGIAAISILPAVFFSKHASTLKLESFSSLTPFILSVAILSSAIPFTFEMMALKKIPPKNFGILMSLEPVVAALSGWLILHEVLSFSQIMSILLIIGASLGSLLGSPKSDLEKELKV